VIWNDFTRLTRTYRNILCISENKNRVLRIFKGRVIDISFDRDGKSQTIRAKLMGRENENVVIEYEGNYFRIPFDQVRRRNWYSTKEGKSMEKNKSEAIEKALNEYIRQIASDLDLTTSRNN